MTPAEIDGLDDDMLAAFVRYMEREAAEIQKANRRR